MEQKTHTITPCTNKMTQANLQQCWINQQGLTLPESWMQWETMWVFHSSIKPWPSTGIPSTSAGESSLLLTMHLPTRPTHGWCNQSLPCPPQWVQQRVWLQEYHHSLRPCGITGKGPIGPCHRFQLIIYLVTSKNMEGRFWHNLWQKGLPITNRWP